jgi:hypothetical protein
MPVSSLYQFLVLTEALPGGCPMITISQRKKRRINKITLRFDLASTICTSQIRVSHLYLRVCKRRHNKR